VFTFWNTFLGQVNIVEIANTSATQASVTVTAFLPDGQITREFPISARTQIDVNLNDLFGLPIDSYGLIGIASASNSLSGRHTQYGPSPDNPNEFDFVYSLPLTNPQRGRTYLSVNTFEAFAPADAPPVYNWLALGNPTESPQGFTVLWYNHNGQLVGNREIPIPALSRVDLEAGHSSYGSGFAGLVEIIPSDTTASYTAASLRIGGAVEGARSNKIFVAANPAQRGNTQSQTVMLDNLPGTYEIVEISNTDNAQGCVWLSVFDDRGSLLSRENITLAPYAQSHVNAAAALPINSSGSLLLEPVEGLSIVATKFLYSQNEALEVNVFSASAVQPFGKKDVGSFNLYLGMANWLRVLNAANDSQTIVVRMHNKTGTEQLLSFNLPSHGRRDLDLHAMQAFIDKSDSYGAISVEAETPGAIVAELLRVEGRPKSQTGFMNLTQFQ
jgi:hypothetical protein